MINPQTVQIYTGKCRVQNFLCAVQADAAAKISAE
jgi:hypothetical protein